MESKHSRNQGSALKTGIMTEKNGISGQSIFQETS